MPKRGVLSVYLILPVLVSLIAGCGGDDDGSTGAGDQSATLKVATAPIADVAPLFLGIDQGFFDDEGLTIEEQFVQSGAVAVPAVVEGSVQIGMANSLSVMSAQEKGLGLRVLAVGGSGGETTEQGVAPLVAAEDGPIKTVSDLEGETIAVSGINSIEQVTITEGLVQRGVDTSAVKFIEVPRPDQLAALDSGRVAAAHLVEPFAVQAKETGDYRVVLEAYADVAKNIPVIVYFTTNTYATENEDIVSRFSRAVGKSLTYSAEHGDEIRKMIPTYTDISPDIADSMKVMQYLPPSTGEWDLATAKTNMTTLAEMAKSQGVMTEVPDMEELFASYPQQ